VMVSLSSMSETRHRLGLTLRPEEGMGRLGAPYGLIS